MGESDSTPPAGARPEGLTFDVICRSSPDEPPSHHPVTVTRDWQILTPHNLDAERIGVALGGVCPCVDLADRVLPAVRGYLTHRLRLEPAAIGRATDGSWRPLVDVGGCCRDQGFPQARDAAAHLRRPQHWAQRYGTTAPVITEFAQRLLDAHAAEQGEPTLADQTRDAHCPAPPPGMTPLAESYALAKLWDAGLSPATVAALVAELATAGESVGLQAVLARAYPHGDAERHRRRGPRSRASGLDRRRRHEREEWIRAGIPLSTVTAIMSSDAYSLNDARILATRLSRSVAFAADLLARWQAGGMTPSVDALVGLHWGPMAMSDPPPARGIERTLELAADAGIETAPVDAAFALVRTGSPPAAVALLADPSRRGHDPYTMGLRERPAGAGDLCVLPDSSPPVG